MVLASGSPQRRAILERLGVSFVVRVPGCEELGAGDPADVTRENALRKARAAERGEPGELILGCDTVVSLRGQIHGKPEDEQHARRTLMALSGSEHEVVSGLALLHEGRERTGVARTAVAFRELDDSTIDWYLARGEWRGRAGGYAIQGAGAALVSSVSGDYENVVGLPLALLLQMLPQLLGGPAPAA